MSKERDVFADLFKSAKQKSGIKESTELQRKLQIQPKASPIRHKTILPDQSDVFNFDRPVFPKNKDNWAKWSLDPAPYPAPFNQHTFLDQLPFLNTQEEYPSRFGLQKPVNNLQDLQKKSFSKYSAASTDSPLREMRKRGKVFINGKNYITSSGSRDSENNSNDQIYNNYSRGVKKLPELGKELLDLFTSYTAKSNQFKGINFDKQFDSKKEQEGVEGYFDNNEHNLRIKTGGFPMHTQAEIALHELTHAADYYTGDKLLNQQRFASDKSLGQELSGILAPSYDHNSLFSESPKINRTDYDKILKRSQKIIDANFADNYPSKNFVWPYHSYLNRSDNLEEDGQPNYIPSEFPAHFATNIHRSLKRNTSPRVNRFMRSVVDTKHKIAKDAGMLSKSRLAQRLQELKTLYASKERSLLPHQHSQFSEQRQKQEEDPFDIFR